MPNPPMAKASIDTMRSLTPRELDTLLVGLSMIRAGETALEALEAARATVGADGLLSDVDIDSLFYELSTCRKVKVCRSNV